MYYTAMVKNNKEVYLILHNIRSTYNVGSIFRTADAAGIKKIYLTGYTPSPKDRFGKDRKDIVKTSLGAEKAVDWEKVSRIVPLIKKLKKDGVKIIALEQFEKAVDYKKVRLTQKTVIILGNEVRGVSKNILDKCDIVAEIPMKGKKESLNVSVSAGVALFRILNV